MSKRSSGQLRRGASLRDEALQVIRQAIVSGEMKPGEIYSVTEFARELGVSPSPVREAMLTLVNTGTLEPVRNRGFRVKVLTAHDLDEIYRMRLLLEVPTVVDLIHCDLSPHLDDLYERATAIERAAADGDIQRFLEHDRHFHIALLGLSNNGRLVDTVAVLRDQTRLYGFQAGSTRLLVDAAAEHREILDALRDGTEDQLRDLVTSHLAHIRTDWTDGSLAQS